MKKRISVILVAIFCFASTATVAQTTAAVVNDSIVSKTNKIIDMMNLIADAIDADRYDNALALLDEVNVCVKEAKGFIAKMENESGRQFIKVALEYLDLYPQGIVDTKEAIALYRTATSNSQMDKANKLYNNFTNNATKKYNELTKIQKEFAETNNMELR